MRTRLTSARPKTALVAAAGLLAGVLTTLTSATNAVAAVPTGFTDTAVISGLSSPTNAVFAPDGRVFVSEKSGLVKTFDSLADTTATITADLRTQTQDFWDRGLLGLALDPAYPTRPYLYVLYTYDAVPGGTAPQWGDQCPTPPGATDQGCVVTGRLSRLTVGTDGVATGGEQVLLTDWCQQYPSHSIGTVAFGPDGDLYVGGGDGASFNFADWGQRGNPCADPPSPAGVNLAPPDARGGALRSQSPRRPAGEPVTLDGTITRVDPDTGATQIVAYGLRNQFRFAFRPGTSEIWAGDVGWNTWEEINRITNVSDATVENFGWPCYEGTGRQSGYDGANLTMCESLYSVGQTAPYYAYNHSASVASGDGCPTGGSSIAGVAFETTSNYPAAYDGALFFADSSRGCIWAMRRGADGLPNPATIVPFVTGVNAPVQVLTGPGGDLYYVALGAGQLRRVSYPAGTNQAPTAVATANPTSGTAPLTVQFTGSGSTDPEGGALTYAWDLDGDGAYDDSTAANPSYTYLTQASVTARLRVTDPGGLTGTASVVITVGNPPSNSPVVTIDNPTASTQWSVGQTVPFAGRAADAQDGTLPASALSWQLTLQHCTSSTNCHAHNVQSWDGIASGSFVAPDHEYPSFLDLTLRATDSDGNTTAQTVRLNPRTVALTFTSSPSGARLVVGTVEQVTPFTRTVIVGSNNSVSAPSPQRLTFGLRFRFSSWSDGGAQSHNIIAPATATTYRANFRLCLC
ncbi:PQQ-dependent sugar dehydrogenase [Actinophytocola sp. NPDC049390]|uniref:PQQ-dependent sugar dehydrogenase n=1 Tax=Actinophytocola sp. NPDC049390 TaxID=3363894 RepID=UPI0037B3DEC8